MSTIENVTEQFRAGNYAVSNNHRTYHKWILIAMILSIVVILTSAFRTYWPSPSVPPQTSNISFHCAELTTQDNYLLWRKSAQMILYGMEIQEPFYQPMWYAASISPICNIDLTILSPQGFNIGDIDLVSGNDTMQWDKYLAWKETHK